ncbi:ribokinase [Seleniivibrio woodruffii]|uniref:Ribokinase n=1 Tax=Seleniivibrio woodruffii TaxID=1078050 RepID=A0A4R1KBV2_9BACT|nr:ribokinase [Seleniivibrio woodruffii]TCK61985.1 ribokinase [Seleniivibrio woodruffii]TVZ34898.1 ribokinase [Seleniivibrio woodruffii]
MSRFCVAGSINIDLVTKTSRFPKPGETMYGESFHTFTGGKGANQAVALAKLGADTAMIGLVGNDIYADDYMAYFKKLGVNTNSVKGVETSTGIAVIIVDGDGENNIIIVSGANAKVDADYILSNSDIINDSKYLLLQLEVPMDAVVQAAKCAAESGTRVILDPAPAVPLADELLKYVDIITPNETEAEILTGIRPADEAGFASAGRILIDRGVKTAVMKAGSRGAYVFSDNMLTHVEGFRVTAVDTTAAGDTFNAGLAYGLGAGMPLMKAVRFANAAAAISTTKAGAQGGMPTLAEAQSLLDTLN